MKHTPGPLTVRVSERWPYDIETVNADGQVVFSDRMPAHSTAMRSHEDLWEGVGFPARERAEVVELNRRAVADATIRASAPDLLEALQAIVRQHDKFRERCGNQTDAYDLIASRYELFTAAQASIARARGEQDGGGE